MKISNFLRVALPVSVAVAIAFGAPIPTPTTGMTSGNAALQSAGPLAFGPDGILFVGDSIGARIVAIDTGDRTPGRPASSLDIKRLDAKIGAALGTTADQISLHDIAVNPASKNIYVSVSRGKSVGGIPVIIRIDGAGNISELRLDHVKYSSATLPNPIADKSVRTRMDAITEVRYVDGKVLVAGLSNEEFSSNMRAIAFPFTSANKGASIEMYHGSHGRYETNAPVRTFLPYTIDNQQYILAAYTCTPLVKIPVSALKAGSKVEGTTIAELGAGNRPLDMISYRKDGHDYILMANSSRGVMKLDAAHLDTYKPITAPTDVTGVPYQTIDDWQGIKRLQKYDDTQALVLSEIGQEVDLRTVALP